MEIKEIIENNTLIAQFIGLDEDNRYVPTEMLPNKDYNVYQGIFEMRELQFHLSFDWLMPVLVKCYQTNKNDDWDMWLNDALLTVNIDELYSRIVEFIKWYNLNN